MHTTSGWPASFYSGIMCIHPREEPSWNTSAGGLGFIYPPASYGGTGSVIARTHGNYWYGVSVSQQVQVAYELYQRYGWSPWSTASSCGLY
ncbi:MAG TPA: hypothetical protein VLG09_04760 [Candidatus Saccharimonadales bacterium]|nr:hypothetical protein [Candidatus Saccharimonadales bacterium]